MVEEPEGQQVELETRPGRRWPVILVWVFVLGLLGLLGFGLIRTQQGPIGIGNEVPDLVLTTFDGESIALREVQAQVLVINFWASWCKPCEQEAQELEQAYQLYKDQEVVFLGVDYVDTETEARGYLEKFNITYPNGPDLGTRISQAFRIRGVPETYIIGPDRRIVAVMIGPYQSLEAIIQHIELAFTN
ncbi:MAG: TlpA family protein disulfide reductase [Anaerolineales bacterium]|nr:MAG: TlpA family protein disulfide reductase [Anaerolineales bacterium]